MFKRIVSIFVILISTDIIIFSQTNIENINFRIFNGNEEQIFLQGNEIEEIKILKSYYGPEIYIKFNENGTRILSDISRENIGEYINIYYGDILFLSVRIVFEIINGECKISGPLINEILFLIENNVFSEEENENIIDILNNYKEE